MGVTKCIQIQIDKNPCFEYRCSSAKTFFNVPLAKSISICDRIKLQIRAPE